MKIVVDTASKSLGTPVSFAVLVGITAADPGILDKPTVKLRAIIIKLLLFLKVWLLVLVLVSSSVALSSFPNGIFLTCM